MDPEMVVPWVVGTKSLAGRSSKQWAAVSNGFCFASPALCFCAFEKRDRRIALITSDI